MTTALDITFAPSSVAIQADGTYNVNGAIKAAKYPESEYSTYGESFVLGSITDIPNLIFPSLDAAGAYFASLDGQNCIDAVNSYLNTPAYTLGSYVPNALWNAYLIGKRVTSTQTLSLVGSGATGTQISATKDASVKFNVTTSTTSTIGGASTSFVALKICATNNATEGNWTTVAVLENDQTITLAIALQSLQVIKGQLEADVPAGWYVKLTNGGSGTHTETFTSGQKTIYG